MTATLTDGVNTYTGTPPVTSTTPSTAYADTSSNPNAGYTPSTSPSTPPPVTPSTPTTTPITPTTPNTPNLSAIQSGVNDAATAAAKIQDELNANKTSGSTTGSSTTSSTTTPLTNTTVNGVDTEAADRATLAQTQADYQKQADSVQNTILSIQNGSTPLNAGEQAQVDGLKSQFDTLIQQQQLDNTGASGVGNIRGYQTGSAEYDPTFQVKTIGSILTAGANKVSDLQVKEASAVASLTQALRNDDISAVKDAYSVYQDASDKRVAALQKTIDDTASAIKAAQDAKQAVTDKVNAVAEELAKNGAPNSVVSAAAAAGSEADAIAAGQGYFQDPTSTGGQYAAYVTKAQSQGLTPMTPADFLSKQKATDAYNSAYASESAKSQFTDSSTNQDKLEQQGRAVIEKELSNRSGGLGIQDAKVNQAIHLKNLFSQYAKTDADGNTTYDIPPSAYTELAMGVASLVSGTNTVAEGTINNIRQATAQGDLSKALTYATGDTYSGSSQQIFQQLKDSVDRQGSTAQDLRQTYIDNLNNLLPTDLSDDRKAALLQGSQLNDYVTAKDNVDAYVTANPDKAQTVSQLYAIPGWKDQDVMDYLTQAGLI